MVLRVLDQPAPDNDNCWVKVFRDHPEWDKVTRWFFMPSHLLAELAICRYVIEGHASETHPLVIEIRQLHPNCILVY